MSEIPSVKEREAQALQDIVLEETERYMREGRVEAVGIPLSGGIDSVTSAYIMTKMLGPERVHLFHFAGASTPQSDTEDAEHTARAVLGSYYDTNYTRRSTEETEGMIDDIIHFNPHLRNVPKDSQAYKDIRISVGQRLIKEFAYDHVAALVENGSVSDKSKYRVISSLNLAENLTGDFVKDSQGSDYAPILSLLKTQVRMLATSLGVPAHLVKKEATGGLPDDCMQVYEEYERGEISLEVQLYWLHHQGCSTEEFYDKGKQLGISKEELGKTLQFVQNSAHKRIRREDVPFDRVKQVGISEELLAHAYSARQLSIPRFGETVTIRY